MLKALNWTGKRGGVALSHVGRDPTSKFDLFFPSIAHLDLTLTTQNIVTDVYHMISILRRRTMRVHWCKWRKKSKGETLI